MSFVTSMPVINKLRHMTSNTERAGDCRTSDETPCNLSQFFSITTPDTLFVTFHSNVVAQAVKQRGAFSNCSCKLLAFNHFFLLPQNT
jgi:hypothetical protein